MNKKGFTLIELLVVIAMILLLMGSVTSSLMSARKRARIAKATTACQEMTNAILAYENYSKDYSLDEKATGDSWQPCKRSKLGFILGEESIQRGGASGKIPVLYNAEVKGEDLLDPWGNPYYYRIKKVSAQIQNQNSTLNTCVHFPNYNRRRAEEID